MHGSQHVHLLLHDPVFDPFDGGELRHWVDNWCVGRATDSTALSCHGRSVTMGIDVTPCLCQFASNKEASKNNKTWLLRPNQNMAAPSFHMWCTPRGTVLALYKSFAQMD